MALVSSARLPPWRPGFGSRGPGHGSPGTSRMEEMTLVKSLHSILTRNFSRRPWCLTTVWMVLTAMMIWELVVLTAQWARPGSSWLPYRPGQSSLLVYSIREDFSWSLLNLRLNSKLAIVLVRYFLAVLRIQIRIKLKGRIRIRIKAKSRIRIRIKVKRKGNKKVIQRDFF